jgi:hypothetical protein
MHATEVEDVLCLLPAGMTKSIRSSPQYKCAEHPWWKAIWLGTIVQYVDILRSSEFSFPDGVVDIIFMYFGFGEVIDPKGRERVMGVCGCDVRYDSNVCMKLFSKPLLDELEIHFHFRIRKWK